MGLVGLLARPSAALSPRILRRPAPAHRHRPRAGAGAAADRRRRAGVGARRLDPGADRQPARRPAGAAEPHLHLHRPRSQRRPPGLRPAPPSCIWARSSRPGRRRRSIRRPAHPYTQALISAVPVPDPRPRRRAQAHRAHGRRAEPDEPAGRLPLPPALPLCHRTAAAASARPCARSPPAAPSPATSRWSNTPRHSAGTARPDRDCRRARSRRACGGYRRPAARRRTTPWRPPSPPAGRAPRRANAAARRRRPPASGSSRRMPSTPAQISAPSAR